MLFRSQDVFSQADLLRKALVDRDEAALRALDGSGGLLDAEGLGFLFDAKAVARIASDMRPVRDIVAAAAPAPLIEKHLLEGRPVYYVYWSIPEAGGTVTLGPAQWMRTVAVCALTQTPDGRWTFYRHLCFDETEGPFATGSDE